MPRPPDQQNKDQNLYNNASGPLLHVVKAIESKTGYESMEFVQETPNLAQQEGDAKSMELV
jgi:hypothetical protein